MGRAHRAAARAGPRGCPDLAPPALWAGVEAGKHVCAVWEACFSEMLGVRKLTAADAEGVLGGALLQGEAGTSQEKSPPIRECRLVIGSKPSFQGHSGASGQRALVPGRDIWNDHERWWGEGGCGGCCHLRGSVLSFAIFIWPRCANYHVPLSGKAPVVRAN